MSDIAEVVPCSAHRSLLRMPEWSRVVQIASDCPNCTITHQK